MARSVELKEAYKKLKKLEEEVWKDGGDNTVYVQVIHEDGTALFYHRCYAIKKDRWWYIMPEHHESVVYHEEEVKVIKFERLYGENS